MMQYLPELLTVTIINLLGAMSPGPDFVMITRNSMVYSRKTGVWSAIGIGLGVLVHVTYCLLGIGLIISQSILLFSTIKFLGAAYLIYIGYKSIRSKKLINHETVTERKADLSAYQAIRAGFLTNALNPKATVFFLSLFTQLINPATPLFVQIIYGLDAAVVVAAWFTLVAVILSHHRIRQRFAPIQHHVERVMGAVLIALGIKVALSSAK